MNGRAPGLALLASLVFGACARMPGSPAPAPTPQPPRIAGTATDRLRDPLPELRAQRPLPPKLRWLPGEPGEGMLVTVVVEAEPLGLPLFEARGRLDESELRLVPIPGGAYLGLVAAPLNAEDLPIEVIVTAIDGTRLTVSRTLVIGAREFPATRLSVASRFVAPDEATLNRIQSERRIVRATLRTVSDQPLWRGAFDLPLIGVTTSPYGQRRLFNNELRSRHTGLDIDGETGDAIYAANDGRVVLSRDLFFNGNAVFIDHGLGLYTGYFHMSKREVIEGEWIEKGEVIGLVGATGRVTGPHLHWSLYLGGVSLDPLSILDPGFADASERLARWPRRWDYTTNP